eukprot:5283383-Pyramimonas_sp.AAC.2
MATFGRGSRKKLSRQRIIDSVCEPSDQPRHPPRTVGSTPSSPADRRIDPVILRGPSDRPRHPPWTVGSTPSFSAD